MCYDALGYHIYITYSVKLIHVMKLTFSLILEKYAL